MESPPLTALGVALASLPIGVLLVLIMARRWSAPRAGAAACLVAATLALGQFGTSYRSLAISSAKGLSLSLFVLTVIWAAVLLYNVVDGLGSIKVIGRTMSRVVSNPLGQALVVGWAFSGFMQGVAGFGVPVAVVTPLLVSMGFPAVHAVAIVLVGHAWSVTYGSLGSSYYTIQLVTGIHGEVIGPHMAMLFAVPVVATGFAVAHLQGGFGAIRRGALGITVMGVCIALAIWLANVGGVPQLASILPGLVGCGVGWFVARLALLGKNGAEITASENDKDDKDIKEAKSGKEEGNFHFAFLPYYVVIALSLLSQIPALKKVKFGLGLDYPGVQTALGYITKAQKNYAVIELMRHPAPLILLAIGISYAICRASGRWRPNMLTTAAKLTYKQCIGTSVGICTMVMMALIMTDAGMTALLGRAIASGTGSAFAVFSPFIGVLGTFMTGSNTNSNVMFGALQMESARALAIETVTIASIQSIGGSLGSSIAPAKVLVGTAMVGLSGKEGEVMKRTIPYCLLIVLLAGLEVRLFLQ
ncbi:L-lactate permease [Pendulispora brunnea]|uniref:L-lactate permease n=1 Tax=Pendulispora brunnea TaxID=2905690 RepID=A0ABZ2K3N8_9BACT